MKAPLDFNAMSYSDLIELIQCCQLELEKRGTQTVCEVVEIITERDFSKQANINKTAWRFIKDEVGQKQRGKK